MSNKRTQLVILVVALQAIFFIGWYAKEADVYGKPIASIMLKTAPIDPRDFLSGQYVRMNYTINRIDKWKNSVGKVTGDKSYYGRRGENAYILLYEKDGIYEARYGSFKKMKPAKGEVVVKGRFNGYGRVSYGIEKYFVPEGTPEPKREQKVTAKVNVYENGNLRIDKVFVDDKIWP